MGWWPLAISWDGLSEAEADATLEFVVSRGHSEGVEEPEMLLLGPCLPYVPLQTGWLAWTKCAAGADARHDANVAIAACAKENGFTELEDELVAPPLMWSEARANLHLELFKGAIEHEDATIMHKRLEAALCNV